MGTPWDNLEKLNEHGEIVVDRVEGNHDYIFWAKNSDGFAGLLFE